MAAGRNIVGFLTKNRTTLNIVSYHIGWSISI